VTSRGFGREPGEVPEGLSCFISTSFPKLAYHSVDSVLVIGSQQTSIGRVARTLHRLSKIVAATVEGAETLVVAHVPLTDVRLVWSGTTRREGP